MGEHTIKALRGETWEAFAALCSRNNGDGSKPVAPTRLWCSTETRRWSPREPDHLLLRRPAFSR